MAKLRRFKWRLVTRLLALPLHGADADAQLTGDLLDALALTARRSDPCLDHLGRTRSPEGFALRPRALETRANPLANHCPLELGVMRCTA
jgi:hypothetical protein